MTFEQRVHAVSGFGFTPRQAAFLTTVMLHSGVCLVRHYTHFCHIVLGQNTRDFFLRLTNQRFATAHRCWGRRGTYYHLHHKGLYAAIGEPDNRHRRRLTVHRAAERLMLLDIVLGHRDTNWLATERDKVAYFVHERQIDTADLPVTEFGQDGHNTSRYFTHKLPIGLGPRHDEVVFVFLITDPTPNALSRFLAAHNRLFRRLRCWTLLLVVPRFLAHCGPRLEAEAHQLFAPALRPATLEEFRWTATRDASSRHRGRRRSASTASGTRRLDRLSQPAVSTTRTASG